MISQKGLPYSTAPSHSLLFSVCQNWIVFATSSQKGGQEHKYLASFSISKGEVGKKKGEHKRNSFPLVSLVSD